MKDHISQDDFFKKLNIFSFSLNKKVYMSRLQRYM